MCVSGQWGGGGGRLIEDLRYVSSGLIHTYPDIFENGFFFLFFSKKYATYVLYS